MEDRISNLPDGVLNHILSFLPTKSAVATGRLSRRWRHLWKHLSILSLSDDSHEYIEQQAEQFKNFALFAYGVLAFLHNPRAIQKLTLDCAYSVLYVDKFRSYSVDTWVRAVIGPHLQELNLNLYSIKGYKSYDEDEEGNGNGYEDGDDEDISKFNLPQTLFTSTNLVSLRLSGGINLHIKSSTVISLPSLKVLLIAIAYVKVSSVNALLCGCPVMETLDLSFSPLSLDIVCIPSSLKRLKVAASAQLEINAPDLEYLSISNIAYCEVFSMYNLHNVVEAHIDVYQQWVDSVIPLHNLLGALSGTKHLVLSSSTTGWLLDEPHDLLFQEFPYLIRLELIIPQFNSNSLLSLLQNCPMLQVLMIHHQKELPVRTRAPQPGVLNCLMSHLTFIQFKGFRGYPDEVSFVEYVLRKGPVLKTVIISGIYLDLNKKYSILKTLSNVPMASGMCQLTFD